MDQPPQTQGIGILELVVIEQKRIEYASSNRANKSPVYRIHHRDGPYLYYQLQNVRTGEVVKNWYEQHELRLFTGTVGRVGQYGRGRTGTQGH